MQVLFKASEEGPVDCLGIIPDTVRKLKAEPGLPVPHMGWNTLTTLRDDPLMEGITSSDYVYFVHSYAAPVSDVTLARTDYGIPVEDGLVSYGEDGNAKTGYDGAKTLFSRYNDMTALFCFNDRVAMGVYDALRQMQKKIPEDVAVIGFDNYEIIAANLYPELTTMQLPLYEIGRWAAEKVLQIAQSTGENESSPQMMFPCPLVMRNSI